ncbi:glycosyltransferase family 2 protein [Chitinophaga barathri]|uniref:Glycosyltransferase family 2 protein n=2 Tax=Chitinophaga barathri TaxID=1647451 RepID=A0A3N4M5C8_9BACT|nr:glycosyltransferase family 2 protein [Chitinophaga barathri]
MIIIFFCSFLILFYSYAGYGLLLYIMVKCRRILSRRRVPAGVLPELTLLIAAYNEEDFIERKIANTQELDYPAGKLQVMIITDGSTDRTPEIIRRYPAIRLLHEDQRNGKTAALNRAMEQVTTPIVVFCDANTLLNKAAILNLVKHYEDPRTGGVAGEKKVIAGQDEGAAGMEGVYWKYESTLKRLDAELYTVVGAAGELFSVRTALFRPVERDVVLDDFIISLRINLMGYRIAYAPDAYAMEAPSFSITDEHKRKVRISAGGFQSIVRLKALLNVFRHPVLSFQYISHRVLRWTLCPLCLPLLLISNAALVWMGAGVGYSIFLAAQLAFYVLAITGYWLAGRSVKIKVFYIPFYFLFMNVAIFEGFFRYIKGRQSAAWEKSARSMAAVS